MCLAILTCLCSITTAQPTFDVISFIADWSIGDTYDFRIQKITQKWNNNTLSYQDSTQFISTFRVMDATENSYTIKWTYDNTLITSYDMSEAALTALSAYKKVEVMYTTNEMGEFQAIINWEEMGQKMKDMCDDLIEQLSAERGFDEAQKEQLSEALAPIISTYDTQASIELFVLKELQYFHFPFGKEFDVDMDEHCIDELPSMMEGYPIKAEAHMYFDSVDVSQGYSKLIQERTIDEKDTKRMITEYLTATGLAKKELRKAIKQSSLKVEDYNSFEYYYDPGIPIFIETYRSTNFELAGERIRKIEKLNIEWID